MGNVVELLLNGLGKEDDQPVEDTGAGGAPLVVDGDHGLKRLELEVVEGCLGCIEVECLLAEKILVRWCCTCLGS